MASDRDTMIPVRLERLEHLLKCEELLETIRLHLRPKQAPEGKPKKEKK